MSTYKPRKKRILSGGLTRVGKFYYSTEEAAEYLSITTAQMRRLGRLGYVKNRLIFGRHYFPIASITGFMLRGATDPAKETIEALCRLVKHLCDIEVKSSAARLEAMKFIREIQK